MWFAGMQQEGVYFSFRAPQRDLIVAAARTMVPLD
jgi:hypothetical protein